MVDGFHRFFHGVFLVSCLPFASYAGSGVSSAPRGDCASTGPGVLAGDTNRPNNSTFVQGETITLKFTLTGSCASAVDVAIVDENGNGIATASVPVSRGVATYAAPSARFGYYRVNVSLADGTAPLMLGTRPAGFISYAVVPDPGMRKNYGDALSRFGMQGGFAPAQGSVIPYLGIRYVLGGAPSWNALEPKNPGQLAAAVSQHQYPPKAPYIDAVQYHGAPWPTYEIAQLASASLPPWAGPLPGTSGSQCTTFGALKPMGVLGLPSFATALGTEFPIQFPNQTKHFYQVTWEPEIPWCYKGSAAQLNQYYKLAYRALHDADPTAQVMGPTLFDHGDEALLAGLYAAGFGKLIDAFSIHPYAPWPFETSALLTHLRAEMAQVNAAAGRPVPFFGTEHGLVSGEIGELNQALGNVREEIALLGEGFVHDYAFYIADFWVNSPTETKYTYGFYWNLNPNQVQGTDKLGPKPAVPAYAAMTYLLDGSTTGGPMANLTGTQMGYRFQRNGATIFALWDYQQAASTANVEAPSGRVRVCDWMGNCTPASGGGGRMNVVLGAAPIYLIGEAISQTESDTPLVLHHPIP